MHHPPDHVVQAGVGIFLIELFVSQKQEVADPGACCVLRPAVLLDMVGEGELAEDTGKLWINMSCDRVPCFVEANYEIINPSIEGFFFCFSFIYHDFI